jgi:hypothetical protein
MSAFIDLLLKMPSKEVKVYIAKVVHHCSRASRLILHVRLISLSPTTLALVVVVVEAHDYICLGPAMDFLHFDPAFHVLICTHCRFTIVPITIAAHLCSLHREEVAKVLRF